jgi:hypothetical protein
MDNEKPQALAMDENGRSLYPEYRALVLTELGQRFERLVEGRDTVSVEEVRQLLKVDNLTWVS